MWFDPETIDIGKNASVTWKAGVAPLRSTRTFEMTPPAAAKLAMEKTYSKITMMLWWSSHIEYDVLMITIRSWEKYGGWRKWKEFETYDSARESMGELWTSADVDR